MLLINDNNFHNSMASPVRRLASWVQLFDNSAQLATYSKNDALKSWEIQRVGDSSKFFGFGVCHRLNIKLRDIDRSIKISTANHFKVWICPDGYGLDTSIYGFPIFFVSEVHRDENTNELSITAYDRLYRAADRLLSETGSSAYTSIYGYAAACASTLGGLNGSPIAINFPDTLWKAEDYPEGGNYQGDETIRKVLDHVAEATQSIYYINYANQLVFKRLATNDPVLHISKEDYITLDSSTNRRLGTIYHTTVLGDDNLHSTAESGTTQFVYDNPFWNLRDDIDTLLENAVAAVGGTTINQFNCSWRGNTALEIGDYISLATRDDDIVKAYVLNDTLTYDGGLKETTEWNYDEYGEGASIPSLPSTLNNSISNEVSKNTAAVVDKINQRIDLIVQDTEKQFNETNTMIEQTNEQVSQLTVELDSIRASVDETITERMEEVEEDITIITDKVAALEITADNISGNVTKVETTTSQLEDEVIELTKRVDAGLTAEDVQFQITESLKNGVNEVTTTTGYVFDAEGLTISKSGSEMVTLITEDGMTVSRNDDAVLIVNNTGVKATNLHATTYLFIGKTSRFEDFYDVELGNRTGCFWVGEE